MRICPRCGTHYEHERFCPEDGVATQDVGQSSPPSGDPLIGQVIEGRYRVQEQIGEGGMGVVYKATHIALNKTVAVKVLRGEMARDADVVQRFAQEAQAASSIGHENIIDIADFGRLPDGTAYFIMEFLNGRSLASLIQLGGALPVQDALSILRQVAGALGAAHQRGIVHRDLKPDNIFVLKRGEIDNFVKVLDFGIAKVGSTNNKLTRTGTVFGTPHYMSPEQAAGQSVDARTDIYALGVIMYEMFTGHVPFDADTFMAVLTKHMFEQPAPMQSPNAGRFLGALERITLRALEKKPELRHQSMFDLVADLDLAAGGGTPVLTHDHRPSAALADALEPRSKSEMDLAQSHPESQTALELPAHRPRRGRLYAAAAAGLTLAVVSWLALGRSSGPEHAAAPPSSVPAAVAVPSVPAPPARTPALATAPVAPAPVEVSVTSEPSGATIVIDDALVGSTPAQLPRPTDTVLMLELRLDGYQREQLRIDAHTPTTVNVIMKRAKVATRRTNAASAPAAASTRRNNTHRSEVVDPWAQ